MNFISSGSTLLDCALNGGYALSQVSNIAGKSSTAKTGLAVEAAMNFHARYPRGRVFYLDAEHRFNDEYADVKLGLDLSRVQFIKCARDPKTGLEITKNGIRHYLIEKKEVKSNCKHGVTVEDIADTLCAAITESPEGAETLYILDSLDAVAAAGELSKDATESGGYGTEKSKAVNKFYRTSMPLIETTQTALIVVSQLHAKIGGMVGEENRSGGKGVVYYSSQMLTLARTGYLHQTIREEKKPYGISLRATVDKNSLVRPSRSCEFNYLFEYGIDDMLSCLDFLGKHDALKELPKDISRTQDGKVYEQRFKIVEKLENLPPAEGMQAALFIQELARQVWKDIELAHTIQRVKFPPYNTPVTAELPEPKKRIKSEPTVVPTVVAE